MPADYLDFIDDDIRTYLSNKSGFYPKSLDKFLEFSRMISPLLAAIVSSEEEARAALDIIEDKIGAVEVEPDYDSLYGDHHAYPSYAVTRFEAEGALALAKDQYTLERLVHERVSNSERPLDRM